MKLRLLTDSLISNASNIGSSPTKLARDVDRATAKMAVSYTHLKRHYNAFELFQLGIRRTVGFNIHAVP